MVDMLFGLFVCTASLAFLSIAASNFYTIIQGIKECTADRKFIEDNPPVEEESEIENIIPPRWNVEEFRERMKNITVDENGLFDFPIPADNEDAGTEIITDSFENEIERRFA